MATSTDAALALDRLRAIQELRAWLDDQEAEAVIGCRMARATWAEMGAAIDATRQAAFNRWGSTIKRYESVGLIDDIADALGCDTAHQQSTATTRVCVTSHGVNFPDGLDRPSGTPRCHE